MSLAFIVVAGAISVAVPIEVALGLGGLFSIVAGINFIVISIATADFALRWRKETSKDVLSKEEPLADAGVVSPAVLDTMPELQVAATAV